MSSIPVQPTGRFSGGLRLLRIEARRSVALLLFPFMLWLAWTWTANNTRGRLPLWVDASVAIRNVIFFVGPMLGGAAAWMAGREGRRGMRELVGSTPRPPLDRTLATWGGTLVWGALLYVGLGAYVAFESVRGVAWGSPYWWPVLTGGLALAAEAAVGYALGHHLRSRFTAPLVAVGLFAAHVVPETWSSSARLLSPVAQLTSSVFVELYPDLGVPHTLLFGGLAGLALASVPLSIRRSKPYLGAFVVSSALCVAGVTMLLSYDVGWSYEHTAAGAPVAPRGYELLPYTPVCTGRPIVVCVHPGYERMLGGLTKVVNGVAAPLVGIPGVPTRAEQLSDIGARPAPAGTLGLNLFTTLDQADRFNAYDVARNLVVPYGGYAIRTDSTAHLAQDAVAIWLLRRAGVQVEPDAFIHFREGYPASSAAADRFARLTEAERRAWLLKNYTELRAGKVGLEELP